MKLALSLLVLAGCGRVGFDPGAVPDDAAAPFGDASPQRAIPPGAKIWLQLETDPDVTIIDSAGGHAVRCVGACPARVAGTRGSGYAFTGMEIDVTETADLDASAGFTAAVWVKLTAYASLTFDCAWAKPFGGANNFDTFGLCVDTQGLAKFDSESQAGVANSPTVGPLALGTWHHLAMSWDGTTKRSFLDGLQIAATPVSIGHGAGDFALGADRGVNQIEGVVDDALYYTRALSADEVAQLATP